MKMATLCIGVGKRGKTLASLFPHILTLDQKPEGSDVVLSGDLKADFIRQEPQFLKCLQQHFQHFKDHRVEKLRYVLLLALEEEVAGAVTLEVLKSIAQFHREALFLALEMELFLILPAHFKIKIV